MARVLVIDDDRLFVKLMVHALQERNHTVEFAFDGQSGTRTFASAPFDVVVCDMLMPEQEGVETIRQLRQQKADVGIVAISSGLRRAPTIDILHVAAQFGAEVTLQKPFKLSQLTAAVERVASLRKQDSESPSAGDQAGAAPR